MISDSRPTIAAVMRSPTAPVAKKRAIVGASSIKPRTRRRSPKNHAGRKRIMSHHAADVAANCGDEGVFCGAEQRSIDDEIHAERDATHGRIAEEVYGSFPVNGREPIWRGRFHAALLMRFGTMRTLFRASSTPESPAS